jgi:hypothetical protein
VIQRALDALIVLLVACLLYIAAFGGIEIPLGAIRIGVHEWIRPAVLLGVALAARAGLVRFAHWGAGAPSAPLLSPALLALLALLLAIVVAYAQHHVRVAGGLDSYGYVSAASLLASGHLSEPQRLVTLLPFDEASRAGAPLGYVPRVDQHTNVPRFPLGLPFVMALFTVFGSGGPFFVPLLMAFGTMALACVLVQDSDAGTDRGMGAAVVGVYAAVLVAADPLMVHYGVQPMSDVPAVFWLIAALWLRLHHPERAFGSGLCAGMAVLTRPALLPAAFVIGLVTTNWKSVRHTVGFAVSLGVLICIQAILNRTLFGSFADSGYGPASHLFEISSNRIIANATNFSKWLTYSHSAFVWLLWPAGVVMLRGAKWAWQVSAVAAAAAAPYFFYLVFDDWESSRFLLPTLALVLILFARGTYAELSRHRQSAGLLAPVLLVLSFSWAIASHHFLEREGVYRFASVEAKYALVGEWFKSHTPVRTVVLAALHSGSIRFYGERETIRWDEIPSDKLEATIRNLRSAGYDPYLALDLPSEPALFQARFGSTIAPAIEQIARVRVVNIYRFVSAH